MDAGELNQRVELMELQEGEPAVYQWVSLRKTWAKVELSTRNTIFSTISEGVPGATLTLRKQPGLDLDHALRWVDAAGQTWHLLPTRMDAKDRVYAQLLTAMVQVVTCAARRTRGTVGEAGRPVKTVSYEATFPGILAQRYLRDHQEESHGEVTARYILLTPKVIQLEEGDLVTMDGGQVPGTYHVTLVHKLSPHWTEHEIQQTGDV